MDESDLPATTSAPTLPTVVAPVGSPLHSRLGDLGAQKDKIRQELERASRYAIRKPDPTQKRQVELAAENPDGLTIVNPVYHMAMIDRMIRFLGVDLEVHQQVYDIDRAKEYLQRVSALIGAKLAKLDPALHAELIEEFKALNREFQIGVDG